MLIALQQAGAVRDTVPADSVVVESPLPGGAAAIARFLFNTVPQWVQIGGVFAGVVVGLAVAVIVWKRRERIVAWFRAKPPAWKMGFAAVMLVLLGGVGFVGLKSWNFMMHDNGFCTGCHVMNVPFRKFTASEHSELGCHDCHRQGMTANVRQLYQWVAERPEEIGAHAPVPNRICAECHIQRDADSTWKRISATAGHAIHLNARSPAMRDMQCVTCHGEEVHRFKPAEQTCAQSGCHDAVRIELGRMAGQSSLHCSTCHQFTAPTVEANPTDSARAALVPNQEQCLECHEMREQMRTFKPENDPHDGVCGACHNPHTQTTTKGAYQSCGTSNCHARSDTLTAMHRGLTGRHKLETCGACHVAHTWKAQATDCRSCHTGISDPAVRVPRPPNEFRPAPQGEPSASPLKVFPHGDASPTRRFHQPGSGAGDPVPLIPASFSGKTLTPLTIATTAFLPVAAGRIRSRPFFSQQADSARFAHARHESVTCTTCHTTTAAHGGLKGTARQCTACHHGNTAVGRACERCHAPLEIAPPRRLTVQVNLTVARAPVSRTVAFEHGRHANLTCEQCHAQDLRRSVQKSCESCHSEHHEVTRNCAGCHTSVRESHNRALHATGCGGSGCHVQERTAATTPARGVCLACHMEQADHKPGRECAPCHLSAWRPSPAAQVR